MDRYTSGRNNRFTQSMGGSLGGVVDEVGHAFTNLLGKEGASRVSSLIPKTSTRWAPQQSVQNIGRFAGYQAATTSPWNRDEFYSMRQAGSQAGGAVRDWATGMTGGSGAPFTNVGAIASGNLANAQQFINTSATRNGIPPNLLAAFIARESTGDWRRDGNRYVYLAERGHSILPYAGMTDPAVRRVGMDPRSLIGDQGGQIEAAARLIRAIADNEAKGKGWRSVICVYYSGDPSCGSTPSDSWQYGSTGSYADDVMKFWNMLEPGGPNGAPGAAPAGGGAWGTGGGSAQGMSVIWGGKGTKDLSYGYNAPNNLGLYGYGVHYGMDGRGHTGVDIPMGLGEPAYSPVSGTVVCSCKGNGTGADGGGCAAFSDVMGQGCGRIEVKLDNGHTLIFGHMSTSAVRVGDRVNAGQVIGGVGGMNGAHIHLEYRIPDRSTSSGWRIVDPGQYLGGAFANIGHSADDGHGHGGSGFSYNPDVPFADWGGRTLSQNRASRSFGQFSGYTSPYRRFR